MSVALNIGTKLKENIIWKPINKLGNSRAMKRLNKEYQIPNDTVISAVGVSSIALKDGLGCIIYVNQSLNNDKIPEDKRKFIATLDLVKGLLNLVMEIGIFIGFSKVSSKLFDKIFGKNFNRAISKGVKNAIMKSGKFKNVDSPKFYLEYNKYKGYVKSAFNQITSLIAASIVAKRIIVPFISTPLAGKLQERNEKKNNYKIVQNTQPPVYSVKMKGFNA